MKNVKFRGKKANSAEKFRGSNFAVKTQIPRNSVGRGKLWALLMMLT